MGPKDKNTDSKTEEMGSDLVNGLSLEVPVCSYLCILSGRQNRGVESHRALLVAPSLEYHPV